MSRSGYSDDLDQKDLAMWRGRVASAIRGKRGQQLLRDMLAGLDAMPQKRLIADAIVEPTGEVCAIGAAGLKRGVPMSELDPEDNETVAEVFGVAECLVQEVAYINDECGITRFIPHQGPQRKPWEHRNYLRVEETPEERYARVRAWVVENIRSAAPQREDR